MAANELLDALEYVAAHARGADMDVDLRKRLAMQQAEDRVPEDRMVSACVCVCVCAGERGREREGGGGGGGVGGGGGGGGGGTRRTIQQADDCVVCVCVCVCVCERERRGREGVPRSYMSCCWWQDESCSLFATFHVHALMHTRPRPLQVADPPLLRLETEACHAYLSVLLHMMAYARDPHMKEVCNAPARMVQLCKHTLSRFSLGVGGGGVEPDAQYMADANARKAQLQKEQQQQATSATPIIKPSVGFLGVGARTVEAERKKAAYAAAVTAAAQGRTPDHKSIVVGRTGAGIPVLMATPAVEYAPFAPLVGSTLRAIAAFDDDTFRNNLPEFFPLMTALIRTDYAPAEVLRALAELFSKRVGPIIGVAPAAAAAEAAAAAAVAKQQQARQSLEQEQHLQAAQQQAAVARAVEEEEGELQ